MRTLKYLYYGFELLAPVMWSGKICSLFDLILDSVFRTIIGFLTDYSKSWTIILLDIFTLLRILLSVMIGSFCRVVFNTCHQLDLSLSALLTCFTFVMVVVCQVFFVMIKPLYVLIKFIVKT